MPRKAVKKDYSAIAVQYAERYGIVNYRVTGNIMIFNVSYPQYLSNPRYTIQHRIDLDTGRESTRKLGRFDSKGLANRG